MVDVKESEAINGLWTLPEGWKWKHLADILTLKYGKPLPEQLRVGSGEYAVFGSAGHIGQHILACTKEPVIIIGRKGTIGSHYFSPDPCWPIDTTIYIDEFPRDINPRYVFYLYY